MVFDAVSCKMTVGVAGKSNPPRMDSAPTTYKGINEVAPDKEQLTTLVDHICQTGVVS